LKTVSILNFYRNHQTVWDCFSPDHLSIRTSGMWTKHPDSSHNYSFNFNCVPHDHTDDCWH